MSRKRQNFQVEVTCSRSALSHSHGSVPVRLLCSVRVGSSLGEVQPWQEHSDESRAEAVEALGQSPLLLAARALATRGQSTVDANGLQLAES